MSARIAYFDCFAGASGDMILGALIDAGADVGRLADELARLGVGGYRLAARKVRRGGFAATKFDVLDQRTGKPIDHHEHGDEAAGKRPRKGHAHHDAHAHRNLADILRLIQAAPLAERIKDRAGRIFTRLAEAEAKAHGVAVGKIHFHEVGAIDAIVDVVGACVAVELLGVERIVCSPLPPGSGHVRCAHGLMPVPTPATAELLTGVPLAENLNEGELTTPTGAAILTTLAGRFAPAAPPGTLLEAIGVGAGTREGGPVPNLLRVMIGSAAGPADAPHDESGDRAVVFETNLDDLDGQTLGRCFELLAEAGALDVWTTPIVMKKNRPAWTLAVLCEADSPSADRCREVVLRHTTSFGLREHRVSRSKLARRFETVRTRFGPIRVKVGLLAGEPVHAQPEYEDCRIAADRADVPLAEVRQAAMAALDAAPPRSAKTRRKTRSRKA